MPVAVVETMRLLKNCCGVGRGIGDGMVMGCLFIGCVCMRLGGSVVIVMRVMMVVMSMGVGMLIVSRHGRR